MISARPRALRPGDRVVLVSPAGPVIPQNIQHGIEVLRSWELDVHPMGIFERHDNGYLAGTDEHRANHLQNAFESDAAAIICTRGGYGVMRILESLDLSALRRTPKVLVGFSDITALHLAAAVEGLPTLHAPVAKSFGSQSDHVETLRRALFGTREAEHLSFMAKPVCGGVASGRVIGGNLSLVAAMLHTPFCPDLAGSILLLEDVGEPDYRLDRLFMSIRLSLKGRGIAGIILGQFTGCGGVYVDDADIPAFVEGLAAEFGVPVVSDFPAGHGAHNTSVPMGVMAEIDGSTGRVTFSEDAVISSS